MIKSLKNMLLQTNRIHCRLLAVATMDDRNEVGRLLGLVYKYALGYSEVQSAGNYIAWHRCITTATSQ